MISNNSHLRSSQSQKPFSPRLTNALALKAESKFSNGGEISIYSQRHNMIIASPTTKLINFYDASTLLPVEARDKLEFNSPTTRISFWPETDIYIFGCSQGEIYAYNASDKRLTQLRTSSQASRVLSITFIGPDFYAFSALLSRGISIGNLKNQDLPRFSPQNDGSYSLYYSKDQKILFSGVGDGHLIAYSTNQLPKITAICSVKAHASEIAKIEGATIRNKEYIITCGEDDVIGIWHLIKGRMKRIRTLIIGELIHGLAYLDDYKMLAITSGRPSGRIRFYSLTSGKLRFTLDFGMAGARHIFVMKDKNAIGVTDHHMSTMKIAQLCSS